MKTLAIIAEYNPFHNGHLYHLNQAKAITGADYAVALMSGNFLQRGLPAMWDKYTRGYMGTENGIDLAIELPFPYATGSAQDFAMGAVSLLNKLNSIDYLCFGGEHDDIEHFIKLARIIVDEPDEYKNLLKMNLSRGLSYPSARQYALMTYLNNPELAFIIAQPNNILALEYICALLRTNSPIKPIIIKRKQAMYHDTTLFGSISSATAIRQDIMKDNSDLFYNLAKEIPANSIPIIKDTYKSKWPVLPEDLTPFLQGQLINNMEFSHICDISCDLSNKLKKLSPDIGFCEAIASLSSKDLTGTRISRSLIHLLLGYTEQERSLFFNDGYAFYGNILSFRKSSSQLIKNIKDNTSIPLITKKADFSHNISQYDNINADTAGAMWQLDTRATNLYNCLVFNRYNTHCPNDYTINIPISQ